MEGKVIEQYQNQRQRLPEYRIKMHYVTEELL
jgi:hypothetical protein